MSKYLYTMIAATALLGAGCFSSQEARTGATPAAVNINDTAAIKQQDDAELQTIVNNDDAEMKKEDEQFDAEMNATMQKDDAEAATLEAKVQ